RGVDGQGQAAVGADEDGILHVLHLAAADLLERLFQCRGEAANEAVVAGEDDVVADALLELRLDPREKVEHRLDGRGQERFAGRWASSAGERPYITQKSAGPAPMSMIIVCRRASRP